MTDTVGDFIIERLKEWGVQRIFGYPGDGINGITAGLRRQGGIEFVQVRHEETASFAACAQSKFGGGVGVCLATSGPGAIHLLNGLYDAKMDHQPVVAIVGQQPRPVLGGHFTQEIDLSSLYKDVASEYLQQASHPAQIRHLLDRAIRIAISQRTVTCVIVPADLQEEKAIRSQRHAHATIHSGRAISEAHVIPSDTDLDLAAEILNQGERVAILVGQGALGASEEVARVAETLGAGVAKALLGKAVLSDELSYVTGSIGLLGTKASWKMMQECDTLLIVGSNMPYSEFLPEDGAARGIQIDIDGRMLGLRYPSELNLVGDSAQTLRALLPRLQHKRDDAWRKRIERWVGDWWKAVEARAMNEAEPINGQRVLWELSPRLPDNAIICCDCGTATGWYSRDVKMRAEMMGSVSGSLLTMGCGVPYAIGAKFTHPDRPCVALLGDGAMQMDGVNELITIAKYWEQWSDPRLVILVLNNRDLNYVSWEQRTMVSDVRFPATQALPDVHYADWAKSLGLLGMRIERPEDIGLAWEQALAADRPCVLDVLVDPTVPPLPPHISAEEAKGMARAVLKGDPDTRHILLQTLKDLGAEMLPRR
jgi:pyruvate dehydrogenase (quinone)